MQISYFCVMQRNDNVYVNKTFFIRRVCKYPYLLIAAQTLIWPSNMDTIAIKRGKKICHDLSFLAIALTQQTYLLVSIVVYIKLRTLVNVLKYLIPKIFHL